MEDSHSQQLGEMQQIHKAEVVDLKSKHATEVSLLNDIVRKAKHWFPMLEAHLQMEDLC
ncbi:MAG TPA: mobilization protein, partial [Bacteroides sp.]|nr:mobilization protein [Bacteroides sp.]